MTGLFKVTTMYIDPNSKKRLTKRQRKFLRGPNAMMKRSLEEGKRIDIGNASYVGCEPVFSPIDRPGLPTYWHKSIPGLPFVRVR